MPETDVIKINAGIIEEFRSHGGRVGGPFAGATMLLLTTTGARTGRRRTNPLTYRREAHRIFVFATNNGADREPSWLHNLRSDPRVEVELGPGPEDVPVRRYAARAVVLLGPDRDEVWARQAAEHPRFAGYAERTDRTISVVELVHTADERRRALGDQLRLIHADLRADLAELRRQVRDLDGPVGRPEPAARLRRHCFAFCDAITAHHTGEDSLGFPPLEAAAPELAPVIAQLREEHIRVAELQQQLREAVAGSEPTRTAELVDTLTAELERHFDYEEEQLARTLNSLDTSGWGVPD